MMKISPLRSFCKEIQVPGDKSISHRAVLFSSLSNGVSRVISPLLGADVLSTMACMENIGVDIKREGNDLIIKSEGINNFKNPNGPFDCGNSGTTMRLLMGILAGQKFDSTLIGDHSLSKRPMKRIAAPLTEMGAKITLKESNYPPVQISGAELKGFAFNLPIASAQLKSALILAALQAQGKTTLTGRLEGRDHTERMLPHYGVGLKLDAQKIEILGNQKFIANDFKVPADQSSAAFWMALAAMKKGSKLIIKNLSLNPTRIGFMNVLKRMGASIEVSMENERPEPVGTVVVKGSDLRGVSILEEEVPSLIDELPIFAIVASQAQGKSSVHGAEELRVKECDRIEAVKINIERMGVKINTYEDGFEIEGPQKLNGAKIECFSDHRIAMSFAIAGLCADGETDIIDPDCVKISYPNFFETIEALYEES